MRDTEQAEEKETELNMMCEARAHGSPTGWSGRGGLHIPGAHNLAAILLRNLNQTSTIRAIYRNRRAPASENILERS